VERRGAQRLINKLEVRMAFEGAGYQTVHPEDMTFEEQRTLFGRASSIAGESGGGMANLVLAPSDCTFICLQTPIEWNLYAMLAGFGGQPASFVNGFPSPNYLGPWYQSPYTINPQDLPI
jgi:hypothetical protein